MPERVTLPTPDGQLVGDYQPCLGEFAVVWVHGFGSHRGGEKAAAVRSVCGDRGWPFAAFDFRGHGETGGPMHELRASRLLEDLARVHAFLVSRGHTRLGLIGSSMGGFAAAWYAVTNPGPVVGCVLLAPAFGFLRRRWDNLTPEQRDEWRRTDRLRVTNDWVDAEVGYGLVEERDRFDPADLARRWATPALIFHGCGDDVVPAADSLAFLNGVTYPDVELRLLKAGDHRLTAYKDEIAAESGRFFEQHLQGGPRLQRLTSSVRPG
jgi:alpha-beta hydrolase superfamily lysophospholipase